MNEFLEQFLIECRELTQRATDDLLALEASPSDKSLIDAVFRAFHTLKGAAGMVDFPSMARVMHEAEGILDAVRKGDRQASGEMVGACLACIDQVEQWLDLIEAEGDLPAVPDAAADALIAGLTPSLRVPATKIRAPSETTPAWVEALLARLSDGLPRARAAVRYAPAADCFFRDEDPLELASRMPDLLVLSASPRQAWPALESLDPFECNLVVTALTAAPPDTIASALRAVSDEVEIWPLAVTPGSEPSTGDTTLSADALAILRAQLGVVVNGTADGFAGRLGSAARVAVNVLREAGQLVEATAIEESVGQSREAGDATAFLDVLRLVVEPRSVPKPGETDEPAYAPVTTMRALRVDVDRIDALVTLAGELTVAKNAMQYAVRLSEQQAPEAMLTRTLKEQHATLDRLVSELRRSVLGIRVLPLRHVFQRFPRLVREMARDLSKSVRLITEGEATEADKTIVEALFEPMLHVLRNALDHGVETGSERRAMGKSPVASIRMEAARDGDAVIVEVSDDGRGIDVAKIRQVAVERSIASPDTVSAMTDADVIDLIFTPGFSTASSVTGVSGRGVGMDAVRSAIARLGGDVTVASQIGQGTCVRFTLPFTVMMVPVMTVETGGQMFGIPLDAVAETALVARARVFQVGAAEAITLRERTIPLIRLSRALDLTEPRDGGGEEARVVVVAAAGQTVALEVDGFGERMDVMLRPLDLLLAGTGGCAGTTLLGDGRVLVVLDVLELLR